MKTLISILGLTLLLVCFPAQAQQPQTVTSVSADTKQDAPLTKEDLMRIAIRLSEVNVTAGGGPFGAVIARDGRIVATGVNRVTPTSILRRMRKSAPSVPRQKNSGLST